MIIGSKAIFWQWSNPTKFILSRAVILREVLRITYYPIVLASLPTQDLFFLLPVINYESKIIEQ